MLRHNSLRNYYETQFRLKYDYRYTIPEQENMIPYELDLHVIHIVNDIKMREEMKNNSNGEELYNPHGDKKIF